MQREAELEKSLLARAREMVPILAERASRADAERRIPPETIDDFRTAGFFRILQPKRFGGYELHPRVFYDVQMTLAEGCASSGWVFGVMGVHNWQLALFDPRAAEDVWRHDDSVLISSSYMPKGQVKRVAGGFRFSGRWSFSSGVDHADWAFLGAIVMPEGDQPGAPDFRTFLVPRTDFEVIDTWHVMGFKGTGSKDVLVKDALVPEYRTHSVRDGFSGASPGLAANPAPLYRLPFGQVFVRAVSAASIGALQGALDAFREFGGKRVSSNDFSATAQDPSAQLAASSTAAAIDEMKRELFGSFGAMMATLERGDPLDLQDRIHYRYQSARAADRCVEHVSKLFRSCGASAIFTGNPIGRFFADIHAARAHFANNADRYGRNYGGVLLGQPNADLFL
nr:flavin-dependent monooxygenase, oxygenase subunit HsaA [uncultured bacterium]